MIEAINSRTPLSSDDIVANSLIYLVGNFRVKLFYPMPTRLNGGPSRGSRTRLDFDVIMHEVSTLFSVVCLLRYLFILMFSFTSLLHVDWNTGAHHLNVIVSNISCICRSSVDNQAIFMKHNLNIWKLNLLTFAVTHLVLHGGVCCIFWLISIMCVFWF